MRLFIITPKKVVNLNSLANSLEKFHKNRDGLSIAFDDVLNYLIRFWDAVGTMMPTAFDTLVNYTVQRGVGAAAVNFLAYEIYRQRDDLRTASSDEIKKLLDTAGDFFKAEEWQRGGEFVQQYLGASRPKALAREILAEIGLDPRWPKPRPP